MINLEVLKEKTMLGCGCSTFGGSVSAKVAIKTLESCFENGIRYYDLARSYGYGTAESIVGQFQKGKRDELIIASKFGIMPPPSFPFKQSVIRAARFIKKQLPASKQIIHSTAVKALNKRHFTPQMVVESLDKSLSEIGTDYLDVFVFHEATFEEMLNDDIRYALEKEIGKGKIRKWGSNISDLTDETEFDLAKNWPQVIQHPFSLSQSYLKLINADHVNVVYSVISLYKSLAASQKEHLSKLRNNYAQQIDLQTDLEMLFYLAFQQLQSGIMLISTSNPNHIKRNVEISNYRQLDGLQQDFKNILN